MYYNIGAIPTIEEYSKEVHDKIIDAWYNAKVKDGAGPVSSEQNALLNIKKLVPNWQAIGTGLATGAPMRMTEAQWREQGAMFMQSAREIQGYAKDAKLTNVLKQTAAATVADVKTITSKGISLLPYAIGGLLVLFIVGSTFKRH